MYYLFPRRVPLPDYTQQGPISTCCSMLAGAEAVLYEGALTGLVLSANTTWDARLDQRSCTNCSGVGLRALPPPKRLWCLCVVVGVGAFHSCRKTGSERIPFRNEQASCRILEPPGRRYIHGPERMQ